jgi:hypothetical protein
MSVPISLGEPMVSVLRSSALDSSGISTTRLLPGPVHLTRNENYLYVECGDSARHTCFALHRDHQSYNLRTSWPVVTPLVHGGPSKSVDTPTRDRCVSIHGFLRDRSAQGRASTEEEI